MPQGYHPIQVRNPWTEGKVHFTMEMLAVEQFLHFLTFIGSNTGWESTGSGASDAKSAHPQSATAAACSFRSTSSHTSSASSRYSPPIGTVVFSPHHRLHSHGKGSLRYVQKLNSILWCCLYGNDRRADPRGILSILPTPKKLCVQSHIPGAAG